MRRVQAQTRAERSPCHMSLRSGRCLPAAQRAFAPSCTSSRPGERAFVSERRRPLPLDDESESSTAELSRVVKSSRVPPDSREDRSRPVECRRDADLSAGETPAAMEWAGVWDPHRRRLRFNEDHPILLIQ